MVIAPSEYWGESLQANVENMLQTKKKRRQRVRSEGKAVTVKVNERSEANLKKFYNSTNINWTPLEKQLRKWGNLQKRSHMNIARYMEQMFAWAYEFENRDKCSSFLPIYRDFRRS